MFYRRPDWLRAKGRHIRPARGGATTRFAGGMALLSRQCVRASWGLASASVNIDHELHDLVPQLAQLLTQCRRSLVTAESCTGGWIGKALTDVAGSSRWYLGGVIAYSNALKQALLGVDATLLAAHGAVSEVIAREMAQGALAHLGGDLAIAVTGIAGPEGGQPGKPVGTVWFGWAWQGKSQRHIETAMLHFQGDREAIRRQTVVHALRRALSIGTQAW
jgi:nicotinamide-nucleotide amidase